MSDQPPRNPEPGAPADAVPAELDTEALREQILFAIRGIYDPEIPVNIHELGLIYRVDVHLDGSVEIDMTLTAPNCPAAQILPGQVKERVSVIRGVTGVDLKIVWDPPWGPDRMSDAAKLQLGML
ncbi:MAG: hypothetical protein BIFFINMI_00462 [Phycisphaerae bacterium]|nr:hypothetical protein [Phycisphaerae bacterium]